MVSLRLSKPVWYLLKFDGIFFFTEGESETYKPCLIFAKCWWNLFIDSEFETFKACLIFAEFWWDFLSHREWVWDFQTLPDICWIFMGSPSHRQWVWDFQNLSDICWILIGSPFSGGESETFKTCLIFARISFLTGSEFETFKTCLIFAEFWWNLLSHRTWVWDFQNLPDIC